MPPTVRRLTLTACLLLASCSWLMPPPQIRGNKVDPEQLKELTPGVSSKADVTAVIGSPTAPATFGDNTWLHITHAPQPPIGRALGALDHSVGQLRLDGHGA